jgi:hypothetical protein
MRYWLAIFALMISKHVLASPFSRGLAVETQSPDALCPDLATTREAIHNRLGTLALAGEERGWLARYTVGHAPGQAGDFVRLELLDPGGVLRLQRDLPRQDEACATLAQAIALVVERYFRELAPEVTVAPAVAPSPTPAQKPVSAPVPLLTPRWALGLGVGTASAQPGAIAAAQAGFWLTRATHLELSLLADLAAYHERLGDSELELRSYPPHSASVLDAAPKFGTSSSARRRAGLWRACAAVRSPRPMLALARRGRRVPRAGFRGGPEAPSGSPRVPRSITPWRGRRIRSRPVPA